MKKLIDYLKRKKSAIAVLALTAAVVYPPATEGIRAVQAAVDAVISTAASKGD